MKIKLTGNIPSKKNSRITNTKTGRSFPSKNYTAWHKEAYQQVLLQLPSDFETITKCEITYELLVANKRKFDLSNKIESLNDLLVDLGVLEDDNIFVVTNLIVGWSWDETKRGGAVINIKRTDR